MHINQVEGRKLYHTMTDRKSDLKTTKATWFRKMGATTTLRVPVTQNSELTKQIGLVIAQFLGLKGFI